MPGPFMLAMMAVPVLLGIVLARLWSGGSTHQVHLRGLPWLIAAAGIHFIGVTVDLDGGSWILYVLTWTFGFVFLWVNIVANPVLRPGLGLAGLGAAANFVMTLSYDGMPYLASSARVAGFPETEIREFYLHTPIHEASVQVVLFGDSIPIPNGYKVISSGDVLLLIGMGLVMAVLLRQLSAKASATTTTTSAVSQSDSERS